MPLQFWKMIQALQKTKIALIRTTYAQLVKHKKFGNIFSWTSFPRNPILIFKGKNSSIQ